jgi:hypothetical protein
MYLGHIIFLTGLALTLKSWLAALMTLIVAIWFHLRVLADEKTGAPFGRALHCLHPARQALDTGTLLISIFDSR